MILPECEIWFYYGTYGDGESGKYKYIFFMFLIFLGAVCRYICCFFSNYTTKTRELWSAFEACGPNYLQIDQYASNLLEYKILVIYATIFFIL